MAETPRVVLAPGRERRVRGGHPWVFATEVAEIRGRYEPGDTVDVVTGRGGFVGRGYINPASRIVVRLLTRHPDETVDEDFYRRRVREAVTYRRTLFSGSGDHGPGRPPAPGPDATAGDSRGTDAAADAAPAAGAALPPDIGDRAFRLIFAESDYLPALIVDYFAGHLVFQALALGVDVIKDLLLRLVREEAERAGFPVRGVYERDDAPVRELEGLRLVTGRFWGKTPPRVTVRENEVSMVVDLAGGQKTGYFLDQRENRAAIAPYVRVFGAGGPDGPGADGQGGPRGRGARVLDCFCYTGGFSVAAGRYGAAEVLGVDSSAEALALARENAALNGLGEGPAATKPGPGAAGAARPSSAPAAAPRVSFLEANVFDFLRQADAEGRTWDVVILDPPAFAKNKAALPGALRGYKEINLRAMKLIPPGGYLITSSCSQHVAEDLFREVVASAAADTRRRARVVEVRGQAKDHPFLPAAPETRYLKFLVLQLD